jgi:hypothetical protein
MFRIELIYFHFFVYLSSYMLWIFFFVNLVRWMGKLKYAVVCDSLVRKYFEQNTGNSIKKRF